MELPEFLTASGLLGILAACAVSSLFFLVQPIWAIIDCIDSDREKDTKLLVSLALFFTWGLGSTLYGLFFAVSRNLRRFTVFTLLLLLVLGVGGVASCTVGAVRGAEQAAERSRVEQAAVELAVKSFRPPVVAADAVEPFAALHVVYRGGLQRSAAVAQFTLGGVLPASARDVSERIRHVAPAGDGLFAITDHDFGAISPTSGELVKIAVDPQLEADFSWPKGLAFDPVAERVVVMTSHVHTRFYRYDPRTAAWERLPSEHRGPPLVGLAYSPSDASLYSLELAHGASEIAALHRFNAEGASVGVLRLDPPIPVQSETETGFQLQASSGRLVLIVPPGSDADGAQQGEARLFLVDPANGAVFAAVSAPPRS